MSAWRGRWTWAAASQLHRGAGRALSGRRDQRHGQFAGHDRRGAQAPARPVLRAVGHRRLESAGRLRRDPGERLPAMGAGARGTLSAPGGQAGAGRQPGGPDPGQHGRAGAPAGARVAADGPWAARIGAVKHPPRHSAAWYYDCSSRSAAGWTCGAPSITIPGRRGGGGAMVHQHGAQALPGSAGPGGQQAFLAEYQSRIERAYPALSDGTVLLPFPRLFIVAGAK